MDEPALRVSRSQMTKEYTSQLPGRRSPDGAFLVLPPGVGPLEYPRFLFVGEAGGEPWILELSENGEASDYAAWGYYAVGSASHFAIAALDLLPLPDFRSLSLGKALVVAHRVMGHAIQKSAEGQVAEPIWVWCTRNGCARRVEAGEVLAAEAAVDRWREAETRAFAELTNGTPAINPEA